MQLFMVGVVTPVIALMCGGGGDMRGYDWPYCHAGCGLDWVLKILKENNLNNNKNVVFYCTGNEK